MSVHPFRGRPAVITGIALASGIALSRSSEAIGSDAVLAGLIAVILLTATTFFFSSISLRSLTLFGCLCLFGILIGQIDRRAYQDTYLSNLATFRPKTLLVGQLKDIQETKTSYLWQLEIDSIGISGQTALANSGTVLLRA